MKTKVLIGVLAVAAILLAVVLLAPQLFHRDAMDFQKSGSFYNNIQDFAIDATDQPDELTRSFLESIQYRITDIDEQNMTATLEISIPDLSASFPDLLDRVLAEHSEKDYETIKQIAKQELSDLLQSEQTATDTTILSLPIEKNNGSYQMIPTEEWNKAVTENLETLYHSYMISFLGGLADEIPE